MLPSLPYTLSLSTQSGLSSLYFGHLVLTMVLSPWLCPLSLPLPDGSDLTPNLLVPTIPRATQGTISLSHGHYCSSCFSPSTGLPKPRTVGNHCLQGPWVLPFNCPLDAGLFGQGGNCSLKVNL